MIIVCPECSGNVSDKAFSCPHCGYPINMPQAEIKPNKGQIRKHKRMPNGSGSIKKLSGNRQKPFAAFAPTSGFDLKGNPNQKYLGTFASRIEAENAIVAYRNGRHHSTRKTFADIYKGFYTEKFEKSLKKLSDSSASSYDSCYKRCSALHNKVFEDLRKADLQDVIDNCGLSFVSQNKIKILFKQMYKYAISHDIVEKDWSAFVIIPKSSEDIERGEPFTLEDIQKLKDHIDDERAQFVLVMIYTGLRIGEMFVVEYDAELDAFKGGLKTIASKNKVVPIHPFIKPYIGVIETFRKKGAQQFRVEFFYPLVQELGIEATANGVKHTPHDCRHTFSWLADKYKLDDTAKHMIMGHSLGNDVEKSVYGHRTIEELRAEMLKIK